MLTAYIEAAMRHARTEYLSGDGIWYAEIPELPGVWAAGDSEEDCLRELREVLEEWIAIRLSHGLPTPILEGHALYIAEV